MWVVNKLGDYRYIKSTLATKAKNYMLSYLKIKDEKKQVVKCRKYFSSQFINQSLTTKFPKKVNLYLNSM